MEPLLSKQLNLGAIHRAKPERSDYVQNDSIFPFMFPRKEPEQEKAKTDTLLHPIQNHRFMPTNEAKRMYLAVNGEGPLFNLTREQQTRIKNNPSMEGALIGLAQFESIRQGQSDDAYQKGIVNQQLAAFKAISLQSAMNQRSIVNT